MDKYEFINLFNKELNCSQVFSLNSMTLCHAFRCFFDERKGFDEIFLEIHSDIEKIEKHSNIQVDLKNEKCILNKILKLTQDNISEMINCWFSESDKDAAKGYSSIFPYRDSELQSGLICLMKFSSEVNRIENEKKSLLPLEIPKDIICYKNKTDPNLITIDDFKILENAYYERNFDIVVYPYFNFEIIEKLKLLDPTKTSISIWPRYYGNSSGYSKCKPLCEERMFGMPFKKEKFKNIFSKEYGTYEYNFDKVEKAIALGFYTPLERLEYVIKPYKDNLISLSLEEIIDVNKSDYALLPNYYFINEKNRFVKHKYLHIIMNKDTAEINHFDISYFYYKDDKIEQRKAQHIKDKIIKADCKKKILRIDSKKPNECFAEFELLINIAGTLMDGSKNPEILNFFNGI